MIAERKLLGTSTIGPIQPDQPRLVLLMVRSARQTLVEVPLADLSFGPQAPCRPAEFDFISTPANAPVVTTRRTDLDALRSFAMLLGVALHGQHFGWHKDGGGVICLP